MPVRHGQSTNATSKTLKDSTWTSSEHCWRSSGSKTSLTLRSYLLLTCMPGIHTQPGPGKVSWLSCQNAWHTQPFQKTVLRRIRGAETLTGSVDRRRATKDCPKASLKNVDINVEILETLALDRPAWCCKINKRRWPVRAEQNSRCSEEIQGAQIWSNFLATCPRNVRSAPDPSALILDAIDQPQPYHGT